MCNHKNSKTKASDQKKLDGVNVNIIINCYPGSIGISLCFKRAKPKDFPRPKEATNFIGFWKKL